MTEAALKCLKQDDLRMFYRGACHVFAVALQRYASLEYQLCRVVCGEKGAYHVYARSGIWLIDVGGFKREVDYLHWLERRAIEHGWNSAIESKMACETELLKQAKTEERLGIVNEWRLFTDPEFLSQAMRRARALVEESDRYRADLIS